CLQWDDEQNIFAGFSDISGLRSKDGGESWSFDYTGHDQNTMYWSVKHPGSGIIYAATSTVHDIYQSHRLRDSEIEYSGSGGKVIYSADGGATWQDLHDFEMPVYWVALDSNHPEKLYASVINHSAGFGGIWKTENLSAGASSVWSKLVNPTRTQGHPASIIVLNDGKVLTSWSARRNTTGQFTNSSGIFLYDPGTGSWEDLTHPDMVYWTKDVIVDPNDPDQDTWYAGVFSGWGGPANDKGGLYRTFNRGQTWERIWETHRVESCAFNPLNPNDLYVTTETEGLWFSSDINLSSPVFELVESYRFMHPLRVFFNPYNPGEVWIASFGNGLKTGNAGNPTQQIVTLKQGWSGISSYIQPVNPNIQEMFGSVPDLTILYNSSGLYWPEGGINTLQNWDSNNGYIIKMNSNQAITFMGEEVENLTVQIFSGWNVIPVLSINPVSTQQLTNQYAGQIIMIKDVAGTGVCWPAGNIHNLEYLLPGKSYLLMSDTDFELDFDLFNRD
nr:exo-alpha-sialidase [Bacteroidota bacterium]